LRAASGFVCCAVFSHHRADLIKIFDNGPCFYATRGSGPSRPDLQVLEFRALPSNAQERGRRGLARDSGGSPHKGREIAKLKTTRASPSLGIPANPLDELPPLWNC